MRPLVTKILTILAATTAAVVATTFWAPELLPSFLKKYIRMIKETKDSYEKWHHNLFVPEEISSKERERFLKEKGTKRRSKKKKGGTLVSPTNNPKQDLTKSLEYTKSSPATIPDFTIFLSIMRDANMTQDEKLELCLETYAPLPTVDNECLSSKGGSGKGDSKGEKSSCNSGKSNNGKGNNGKSNNGKGNNGKGNNGKSNNGKGNNGKSNNGKSNNGKSNISSKNKRNLSSGGGKGSGKGSSKGQKSNSGSFTTFSGGTCLCSCGNPELTEADKCWEQFGPPIDCDNGSQLTFNGNVILLDEMNSDNKSTSKGGKGGSGKGSNKSQNRSRRVLREIENRQLLICGPDPVSPIDPISSEKIALINDFVSKNDITCSELESYLIDKSSTCANKLINPTDAPSSTFKFFLTGQSVILEDVNTSIGGNFQWEFNPIGDENIVLFTLSGIPAGTTLTYNVPGNPTPSVWTSTGIGSVLNIPVTSEKDFQSVLGTLSLKSAPQTDSDFVMIIGIATDPFDPSKYMEFEHPVTVIPVPDPAKISTTALTVTENITGENKGSPLNFSVIAGEDQDNSETLSVVLTVPSDDKGLVGRIIATSIPNVDFRDIGNGVYTIQVTGPDPITRQNLLNEFIANGAITFVPRENLKGIFEGESGIKVEAISTENATGESTSTISYIDIIILENDSEPKKSFPGCPTTSPSIPMNITNSPSSKPSQLPSQRTSLEPSVVPSHMPSSIPSSSPSLVPFYLEMNNTSVIIEDLVYPLGLDIQWNFIASPVPTLISRIVLKNIPAGTTLTYTDPVTSTISEWVSDGVDSEFIVPGDSHTTIRTTLDTLIILGPPQSDEDFSMIILVTTDPALENNQKEFIHPIKVQARADAPMVAANNITVVENLEGGVNRVPLYINVNYGADRDNSEVVSLVITIPADAEGVYGSLTATSVLGVAFTDLGGGIYTVNVTAATPSERETLLNNFLGMGSIKFTPRENFAGELIGQDGIKVEAISSEGATGYGDGLAPKGTEGDLDPRIASDIAYISVFVIDNSSSPSSAPSRAPSWSPSVMPSTVPSKLPSSSPSSKPSQFPSQKPSLIPSSIPSSSPSLVPFYLEMNNTSVIIEDLVYPLGLDIQWNFIASPVPTLISRIVLKNIPAGTTLTYTDPVTSTTSEWVSDGVDSEFIVPGASHATIRTTLDTLTILGPPQSDEDFNMIILVTTDPALENNQKEFIHPIKVQARADAPVVTANNITVVENLEGGVNRVPLYINVNYGADRDNSEVVSLVITIPADAEGVYGSLTATSVPGVVFTGLGGGIYTVNVTAATPSERETLLNNFLGMGSIKFTPRENFAGELIGQDGIKVEAISTEGATGYDDGLAPKGTEGDLDPRIASDIAYISVFVIDNSSSPSSAPSRAPSWSPSVMPSTVPSKLPSSSPSSKPSQFPSQNPSLEPSVVPSLSPSSIPSSIPSSSPSLVPFYLEMNNTSVIIEDLVYPLGLDIQWNFIASPVPTLISRIVLKNIPAGTTLTYTDPVTSTTSEWVSDGVDSEFIVPGDSHATIRTTLDTLTILGPPQSDEDFNMIILVTTDPALENNQKEFIHPIKVQARADAPVVTANNITVVENLEGGVNRVPLYINVNYGADRDNSEVVSLVITIPADAEGVYGSLTATSVLGVAFTDLGGGIYTVNVTAATPSERETLLNNFLGMGSIKFTPRENFAGELIGQDGIKVEAISTEGATGYGDGLAPKGTEGGLDPRIASDIAYISVFVIDNSSSPSSAPSRAPSWSPSVMPSTVPSKLPSSSPSSKPSQFPSQNPSLEPSVVPSLSPSSIPSSIPSSSPSLVPFYLEMNNTSVIIEDLVYPLGLDIQWNFIASPVPTLISRIVLKNIPAGTTLTYTDPVTSTTSEWVSDGVDSEFIVPGDSHATIRTTLDTLTILGPPQSDEDFNMIILVTTDPALENNQKEFIHPIKVQARADAPVVTANNITVVENLEGGVNRVPLYINVNYGADRDNSEVVSLVITIPADAEGVYGSLTATSVPGVVFTDLGGGIYTVNVTAATPSERETLLNNFLGMGSIKFTPRENFAGELIGQDGIKVEAISTEGATGYGDGLAPKGTEGGLDPRIASDIAYISVFVIDNSSSPSSAPSRAPSWSPSVMPSTVPSKLPSSSPSSKPSQFPSQNPSLEPSVVPSLSPSSIPSSIPSSSPSLVPFYLEMNNTSVIIEDLVYPLGLDIQWNFIASPVPTLISRIVLKNIPAGTTLTYTDPVTSTTSEWVSDGVDSEFIVPGDSHATIRTTLDTLTILGPPQSDEDFSMIILVTTDPALENNQKEFIHPIKVQARADAPMVAANNVTVVENLDGGVNRVPLYINVNYGADRDNSEVVSLVITIPADAEGVYGSLTATSVPGVAFTDLGGGIYTVNVTAATPSERETLLNNFLGMGSIKFTPRENFAGELIGQDGIKVEAISTEGATGYGDGLAPKGTEGDLDPRIASDIAYISVFVIDNSSSPSSAPSRAPSWSPSVMPSTVPSKLPSSSPSSKPSQFPSQNPSLEPSVVPSLSPSSIPSSIPSSSPSLVPFYLEMNNTSVIIEDLVYPLGLDIQWNFIASPVPTLISRIVLKNIPAGTTLTYTDPVTSTTSEWVSDGVDSEFIVPGDSHATIRTTLDTLTILGPPQSDEDFNMIILVTTDPALENNQKEFIHPIKVQARADAPVVTANNITVVENLEGGVNRVPLYINVNYGADRDNSEVVSLVITIPADAEGVYGSLTATSVLGVAFTDLGGGIYTVNVTAATPSERETLLNNFLGMGSIKFTPRENFAGELIGQDGIKVEAISTEGATGYDDGLAPKGTEGDLDPRIASDIAYISVFVIDNSSSPSSAPSRAPSWSPSVMPSTVPSKLPSSSPSSKPSQFPSQNPSLEPSVVPSLSPSSIPSSIPSSSPSLVPFYLEMNNTSVIIEDLVYPLGLDIQWNFIASPVPTLISRIVLKNIPAGTTLTYTDPVTSTTSEWVSDGVDSEFIVPGDSHATIRTTLDTLTILGPPQSDEDFSMIILVTTDPALENNQKEFIHPIKVQARADAPMVAANNVTVVENLDGGVNRVPLYINVNYGADRDNSEVVSLVITIPADAEGVYGSLTATSVPGVAFTDLGGGIYTVNVTAATPSERETLLNNFLGMGSIKFTPRENFAGELIGQDGIKVEAISTEGATGYGDGLAPKGTEGDLDPRIASDIAYISVFVIDNSSSPSSAPSRAPSWSPSVMPSTVPSKLPSSSPSSKPSQFPSQNPSLEPSVVPSLSPSSIPSSIPSSSPSLVPFYLEMNNTSVIIEDLVYPLGLDIQWNFIASPVPTLISRIVLKNIPAGTTLTYTDPVTSTTSEWVSDGVDSEFIVPGDSHATIRTTLDTLTILGPPQSDEDFNMIILVTTDPALENNQKEFIHPIKVQARADAPVVTANNITVVENLEGGVNRVPLYINVNYGADRDNSEVVSLVITIPADAEGVYGSLTATSVLGVAFTDLGGGIYTVNVTAATPSERETLLNNFLGMGSIKFTPRENFAGELIGQDGIKVEAISTEGATGYGDGLAPKGTEGGLDPRIASDIAYISVFVIDNSSSPSSAPSRAPSWSPSVMPSTVPSKLPSSSPSSKPSQFPSQNPSLEPSVVPSLSPSSIPSSIPSSSPSLVPFYLEMNNTSVIIEDLVYPLGLDIQWNFIASPVPTLISRIVLKNIPAGTTLTYTDPVTSTTSEWVSDGVDSEFIVPGDSHATIRTTLDTLTILGPPQSDEDFNMIILVTTDPALENNQKEFIHPIKVQARADAPMVAANNITVVENLDGGVNRVPLYINVNYGADRDNSEVVSLVITIPADAEGVYGSLTATSVLGVAFTDLGGGIYTVNVTAATPSERETLLNNFLGMGSIKFTPRENFAGELIGQDGIKVEAISTEGATGYDDGLAPKGTEGDLDPRIASDIAYISVFVIDNSSSPSSAPSRAPSWSPSVMPSTVPSKLPSSSPSSKPSQFPSQNPSLEPSVVPSLSPSSIPSSIPSSSPSLVPFYLEMNNTSVIIEDLVYPLGLDIQWNFIASPVPTLISRIVLKNIPAGTTLTYTDPATSTTSEWVSDGVDSEFIVPGDSDATIRTTLDTLTILGPPQSDEDFNMIILVTTDPALENNQKEFIHPVKVQARADAPMVTANNITVVENLEGGVNRVPLYINVNYGADRDNSEVVSLVITIPADAEGVYGSLTATSVPGVAFTDLGGGIYTVNVTAATPSERETLLNNFLGMGSIKFTPRENFAGELIGQDGIKVEAISTEGATGYDDGLAPKGTEGDLDPRIASDIAYISVFVIDNSSSPSSAPSRAPSWSPSVMPSTVPSKLPSSSPSSKPSQFPSQNPSLEPSVVPSLSPSSIPSSIPSSSPSLVPFYLEMNNTSVIIEDLVYPLGLDIQWNFIASPVPTLISRIVLKNIPAGTTLTYTDPATSTTSEWVSDGVDSEFIVPGDSDATIRTTLDTLIILGPPQSDEDFSMIILVTTDPALENNQKEFIHPVKVQARADAPVVTANNITVVENLDGGVNRVPLYINVNYGADRDNSEVVSLVITIPADAEGVYGSLTATSVPGVAFTDLGGGIYTVNVTAATPSERETLLNNFLGMGSIKFTPRENFAGELIGQDGIKVEAISTEGATGYGDGLAPKGTEGDLDPRIASDIAYISVFVIDNSSSPSSAPSRAPSWSPSVMPSTVPSKLPSSSPSSKPSQFPSQNPSLEPSVVPSLSPSSIPSSIPSSSPSLVPFYLEMNNTSVIIEDLVYPLGLDIQWNFIASPVPTLISRIVLKNIPAGTTLTYTDPVTSTTSEWVSDGVDSEFIVPGDSHATIRTTLDTLTILGPPQSDEDFSIIILVTTDPALENNQREFIHPIKVQARADAPVVIASNLTMLENLGDSKSQSLFISIFGSADMVTDDSELISVVIKIPHDEEGAVGTLSANSVPGVVFYELGGGIYTVNVTADTSVERLTILNDFLGKGSIKFTPRIYFVGELTESSGIIVEAISTESATGYNEGLAPKGTEGDLDPRIALDIAYISLFIITNSQSPSTAPSLSSSPSHNPSTFPSLFPSSEPSFFPSNQPSSVPSSLPSHEPSAIPSTFPSLLPSSAPSQMPSSSPSMAPSREPSSSPSAAPSLSSMPSSIPSSFPSFFPSSFPSTFPSNNPSEVPSSLPSHEPSVTPSTFPSLTPSSTPSQLPSSSPSTAPSSEPSSSPSDSPSFFPYPFEISGTSTLVEDVPKIIGKDFDWEKINTALVENIAGIFISNFPIGSTVSYEDSDAPLNSDEDFALNVTIRADTDNFNKEANYVHQVKVQAVADPPSVGAEDLEMNEDSTIPLTISASSSLDKDNSEVLSMVFKVASDSSGIIGTLTGVNRTDNADISIVATFTGLGNGVYTLNVTGPDVDTREAFLSEYLLDGLIEFTPREHWSGIMEKAIEVKAVSTERAIGYGDQLAPNDSPSDGTGGDEDTKIEVAFAYVRITVYPVNEELGFTSTSQIVPENGGTQDDSLPTLVDFGRVISELFNIPDQDGSQSVSMTFVGFPDGSEIFSSLSTLPSGAMLDIFANNTVVLFGNNVVEVHNVLSSLQAIIPDDSDKNFILTVTVEMTDVGAGVVVVDTTVFTHSVVIQAVADIPTVIVPQNLDQVEEGADFSLYPVIVGLNDPDGSETYETIVIQYSTPGNGKPPIIRFQNFTSVVFDYDTPGEIIITGNVLEIEATLLSMEIKPGMDNGEDITIVVKATSVESNPSEVGLEEILIPTASKEIQFVIDVIPVVGEITITVNGDRKEGLEDNEVSLGTITIDGALDLDGSESFFLEFKVDELPPGLKIKIDGIEYQLTDGVIVDGHLQLPGKPSAEVALVPPLNWSGSFNVVVRGAVTDTASDGDTARSASDPITIPVDIFPVGDCFDMNKSIQVIEDQGPANIGSHLANTVKLQDNGDITMNNNPATETIIQIDLIGLVLQGTYVPALLNGSSMDGFGNTLVQYTTNAAGNHVYSITSKSTPTGASTEAELQQIETEIRKTLESFTYSLISQSDASQTLNVEVTSLDVNLQVTARYTCSEVLTIAITAVADEPTVLTTIPQGVFIENGPNIPLDIVIGASVDGTDGSEDLIVTITVPQRASWDLLNGPIGQLVSTVPVSDVVMTELSPGVYRITVANTAAGQANDAATDQANKINSFLAGLELNPFEYWAGTSFITVDVTSVEEANKDSATVTSTIEFTVLPVAGDLNDSRFKANALGFEDEFIRIPMELQLMDRDGSERFEVHINPLSFPDGTTFYRADGSLIKANETGWITVPQEDAYQLRMKAPPNWSTMGSGEIKLEATAEVIDEVDGFVSRKIVSKLYEIEVYVTGVARFQDEPEKQTIVVLALEDEAYDIGSNINVSAALVDNDGSEQLFLTLSGLPRGVIPFTGFDSNSDGISDGITLIDAEKGIWQISQEAIPHLKLPPVKNYSGGLPYPKLTLQAFTQEIDLNMSENVMWEIFIEVAPVADGIPNFDTQITAREGDLEQAGGRLSLAEIGNHRMSDQDNSEFVISYTIDFSTMIDDAQIRQRLLDLDPTLDEESLDATYLIEKYLEGYFVNNGDGTVTVAKGNIGGLFLKGLIFWDLSGKWKMRMAALIRDEAMIDGVMVNDDAVTDGELEITVLGTADIPTVIAEDASGLAGELILVQLGGESTDTDIQLGRVKSETVYYFLSLETDLSTVNISGYVFTDADGGLVGFEAGERSWFFTYEDLQQDVFLRTNYFANGTLSFLFTAVAAEDNTIASNSKNFEIDITYNPGPGSMEPPCEPTLTVSNEAGIEDELITLDWYEMFSQDCVNDTVSVIFRDFPQGWTIGGAYYNNATGKWVTDGRVALYNYITDKGDFAVSLRSLKNGLVTIGAPEDFSGSQEFNVEVIAKNMYLESRSSGIQSVTMYWEPVADGVAINVKALQEKLFEDQSFRFNISYSSKDVDGSEIIGDVVFIQFEDERVQLLGYEKVEGPFSFQGHVLSWYYIVSLSDLEMLEILPPLHWHGDLQGSIYMNGTEILAPNPVMMSRGAFTFQIEAVADVPLLTVPTTTIYVNENDRIQLPDLSASLVDTMTENGREYLSVIFEGVPLDSFFSNGSGVRVGEPSSNGVWTIYDPADLSDIMFRPPPYWSGTLTLKLTATVIELSNGSTVVESMPFEIVVEPVASPFEILTNDIELPTSGFADLRLNIILLDDRGSDPGENPAEIIVLSFTDVPDLTFLRASKGGSLQDNGSGMWTFTGTEDQANSIQVVNSNAVAQTYFVSISGKTKDMGNELADALSDDFPFRIFVRAVGTPGVQAIASDALLVGTAGNDILYATALADQTLDGGDGMDIIYSAPLRKVMTGGAGADQFVWRSIVDLEGVMDTITDFSPGDGDQLNVGGLLPDFDIQMDDISQYGTCLFRELQQQTTEKDVQQENDA
ncbi:hypothetical protein IV203_001862 [Nitzschia inconspicua]|uniref:Uncharacterized protein n=1 Tax=Nitzschia inconspicua TaxID=303405 RepID=A0A9K3L8G6_9STRA|nr:hypothetical protein IV203_001862 [Nitzschia inconspicua]